MGYPKQYKVMIGVSGFLYLVFMSLIALTIYKGVRNVKNAELVKKKFLVVAQGLN